MFSAFVVLLGVTMAIYVLNDIFQSVVVPRPTPARFRLTRWIVRPGWRLWRFIGLRARSSESRERFLGTFAPLAVVVLIVVWLSGLVLSFGIVFYGIRTQLHPGITDFPSALYFAGTSVLTIGLGDFVSTSGILIVTLDARAGAPPSGVSLLETMAKYDMTEDLPRLLGDWEKWGAEVLDSHLAYPLLAYFRSSHDSESWISALGAVLDASTLLLTTVVDGPRGPAKMMFAMGTHLVEDLGRFFHMPGDHDVGVERYEFDQARERLSAAGWRLIGPEESWLAFSRLRVQYASQLNSMAKWFAAPPTQWIGDRSYVRFSALRHRDIEAQAASG
jgi:hypothetical protein